MYYNNWLIILPIRCSLETNEDLALYFLYFFAVVQLIKVLKSMSKFVLSLSIEEILIGLDSSKSLVETGPIVPAREGL